MREELESFQAREARSGIQGSWSNVFTRDSMPAYGRLEEFDARNAAHAEVARVVAETWS